LIWVKKESNQKSCYTRPNAPVNPKNKNWNIMLILA